MAVEQWGCFLLPASLFQIEFAQSRREFVRFESKWTGPALVGNAAILIDEIDSVGPSCVSLLG